MDRKTNRKHFLQQGILCLAAAFAAVPCLAQDNGQEAGKGERLGAYINYTSDNQRDWLNQVLSIYTEDPAWTMLESPFKTNYEEWGEVVAGTWVENEWYVITNLVRGGMYYVGKYIAYEPLTQNYRFIDESSGLLPANSADMTYNPVSKELFAITKNNELLKLSLTDSSSQKIGTITVDGLELQDNPFRTLACNNDGILYAFNDNANIYQIDPLTAKAEYVSTLDQAMGVYGQSATFSPETGKCYWVNAGSANILYEVDVTTGKTTEISSTPGLAGLFVFHYPGGAPAQAIPDLRVVKNPSDYREATFVFHVPSVDMMGEPIQGRVDVEVWKGVTENDMSLHETLRNIEPGQSQTFTDSETSGTFHYAFRIKGSNGLYSNFTRTQCAFFNVSFPYRTSFEEDEANENILPVGPGWIKRTNTEDYTLVRTGTYSYGAIEDITSVLRLSDFPVFANIEYELSFYVAGYNAFWDYVMSTSWYEAPEKPLHVRFGDTSFLLELDPQKGETGYDHLTRYTFRYTPEENGTISVEFQLEGEDDAYFIDDLALEQITARNFPASIAGLELSGIDHAAKSLDIQLTAPATTADNTPLTSLQGIIVQASRYRNFLNEDGLEEFLCDTLENPAPGEELNIPMNLDKEGFWYFRAYAYNKAGLSLASPLAESGYIGNGFDLSMETKDRNNQAIGNARIQITPLFPESDKELDTLTDAQGNLQLEALYAGKYGIHVASPRYNDTNFTLSLEQDLHLVLPLSERQFHPWPLAPTQMEIIAVEPESRQISLSWTNPAFDQDSNALESLEGIAFAYSLDQNDWFLCDTVSTSAIGQETEGSITIPQEGYCHLQAFAFNAYGTSDTLLLDAGYVGNGRSLQFLCQSEEDQPLANVKISLFPLSDTLVWSGISNTEGIVTLEHVRDGYHTLIAFTDFHERLVQDSFFVNADKDTSLRLTYTLQQPEITKMETVEPNTVNLSWSLKQDRNFRDGFESYPDWEIENIGDYELHGAKNKGYFGGLSFPNMQMKYAYLVFNPSASTPAVDDDPYWTTHSGNKMLISAFSYKNDDWLIHSVDGGGTLRFYASGAEIDGSGPERFQVLYSTTDNNPGNFIKVSEGEYVTTTTDWDEYSFVLPDNARYFAVHCVSEDASLFKLDDLSYTLSHGAAIAQATGFEIYRDNSLVATVPATDSTYSFQNLPNGTHTLGIRALYEKGASETVTRTVTIGREIPAPLNLQAHNTDTGWLLTWEMPGNMNAQYYKVFCDGEFVINTQYKQWFLGELQANEGHYAGVCAVDNEYFSDTVYIKFGESSNEKADMEKTLQIWPNPSSGNFQVAVGQEGHLSVFTIEGKRVLLREITAGIHEFQLGSLPKGIYMLRFENAQGAVTQKLVLQ